MAWPPSPQASTAASRRWIWRPRSTIPLPYYLVFYRSQLIPRWLSVWGLAGTVLCLTAGLLVLVQSIAVLSSTQVVLSLPIGVQEMVLAVWLIVKGFSPKAKVPAPRAAELSPV
jgi:hypothetical protein